MAVHLLGAATALLGYAFSLHVRQQAAFLVHQLYVPLEAIAYRLSPSPEDSEQRRQESSVSGVTG